MTTSPSKMTDVMIDIESMSLHPHNALILSVGLCEFDPWSAGIGPTIGDTVLLVPKIAEQLYLGREVSASTQAWWKEQPPEASDHWLRADEHWSLTSVIGDIKKFCEGRQRIWANGIQFDLSNIVELKAQIEARDKTVSPGPLWHYQAPRDMRTFCKETPVTKVLDADHWEAFKANNDLVAHHPVSDCLSQSWSVWEHWPTASSVRSAA